MAYSGDTSNSSMDRIKWRHSDKHFYDRGALRSRTNLVTNQMGSLVIIISLK
jgi:hypothetical protein